MKKFLLIFSILLQVSLTHGQSEFQKHVDQNSKKLPFDAHTIQVIKENLVNSMNKDLDWQDKVVWIKGVVRNYEFASFYGKCKTEKEKVLYFSATAKSEQILWDIESLPKEIKTKMEEHQKELVAQKNKNELFYSNKLKSFDDSLINAYNEKYNKILEKSKIELDTWNEKMQFSKSDPLNCYSDAEFILNNLQSAVENAKESISSIVWPIEAYKSRFKNGKNEEAFNSIVKEAIDEANSKDAFWDEKINSLASELSTKLKYCSKEKKNNEIINSKKDSVISGIANLYPALFERKNKKRIKNKIASATQTQLEFYNQYFADLNELYGIEYYIATTSDSFRVQVRQTESNTEKIEHLDYWLTNLKYWNEELK